MFVRYFYFLIVSLLVFYVVFIFYLMDLIYKVDIVDYFDLFIINVF